MRFLYSGLLRNATVHWVLLSASSVRLLQRIPGYNENLFFSLTQKFLVVGIIQVFL